MLVIVILFVLLALLLFSVPVAATMASLGLFISNVFSDYPLHRAMGEVTWSSGTDFLLMSIPLFVLLGEILLQTDIAERTYIALDRWLSWLPGGLMQANVATSAMFSATSGSSVATAATITTVAIPQARVYKYSESLFSGSIAAGGTLGILIPPSINLIVYGFLTNTSIPQLFIAGIVPGILLAILFMVIILLACLIWPGLGGEKRVSSWKLRFSSLADLIPVLIIFFIVIGSIYTGFATPTESAALGVVASLMLAAFYRKLSFKMLKKSIEGTMRTTAMIMLILTAANFLNFTLVTIGLTDDLSDFINSLNMTPLQTLMVIITMYVVLGFFIETLSLMVITIPIVTPVIVEMGFDRVWFGILLILLIEMALITPPVGLNLYVVQGVRRRGKISEVMVGSMPFVVMLVLMLAILVIFPGLPLIFLQ